MDFLNRLFGKTPSAAAGNAHSKLRTADATLYTGNATLEVVGESHYQDTLWKIVGGYWDDPESGQQTYHRGDSVRYRTHALLIPEPNNLYDANAIGALINFEPVGYLSRDDAAAYRPGLMRLIDDSANRLVALKATIAGGGQSSDGPGLLGVFLDHDPADFGIKAPRAGLGFRTGLSEAFATDLEDDSYDLSWYSELSDNDTATIKKLRSMLGTHRDPIDRHYMTSELEKRLYKSRDAFSSALDEFDDVCRQHDAQMVTIRPALLDKFGSIPVIDMYRQAAVRCQKARDWAGACDWAERGISVYGDHAARPEVVEDLHKRLKYATTKIEAANRPKAAKPAKAAAR